MGHDKILAIGAFNIPYIHENWRNPLEALHGSSVVFVNANMLLRCLGLEATKAYIYNQVKQHNIQLCLFYHDWIFEDFKDDFFKTLRSLGVKTVAFYPDDQPVTWFERNRKFDKNYDLIASHSMTAVKLRKESELHPNVMYCPWGYNPRIFMPPPKPLTKDIDIVFIGKNKIVGEESNTFREDGKSRHQVLYMLGTEALNRGWNFKIFGYGWSSDRFLNQFYGGELSVSDMVQIYHRTKLVFNPAWSNDEEEQQAQVKLRHFEVAGCHTHQITNINRELQQVFSNNFPLISYYSTKESLIDTIEKALCENAFVKEGELVSTSEYLQQHTMDYRIRSIIDEACRLFDLKINLKSAEDNAQFLLEDNISGSVTLSSLQRSVVPSTQNSELKDVGYFRIQDESIITTYVDPGLARHIEELDYPDAIAVGTIIEIKGFAKNALQPIREEIQAHYLPPTYYPWEQTLLWRDLLKKFISIPDRQGAKIFLSNIFFKCTSFNEVIDYINGQHNNIRFCIVDEPIVELSCNKDIANSDLVDCESWPHYIIRLRDLTEKSIRQGKSIALYGVRGEMAERALEFLKPYQTRLKLRLIDNAVVNNEINGIVVQSGQQLLKNPTDYAVIAAPTSGEAIIKSLRPIEDATMILPLYNPQHPLWSWMRSSKYE
jgi:spore maturation protein CgeB